MHQGSIFSTSLPTFCWFLFSLYLVILISLRWYLMGEAFKKLEYLMEKYWRTFSQIFVNTIRASYLLIVCYWNQTLTLSQWLRVRECSILQWLHFPKMTHGYLRKTFPDCRRFASQRDRERLYNWKCFLNKYFKEREDLLGRNVSKV